MAEAVAEGVREVPGSEAVLRRVPGTLPAEVIGEMAAARFQGRHVASIAAKMFP